MVNSRIVTHFYKWVGKTHVVVKIGIRSVLIFVFERFTILLTECCGQVFNTPASSSGDPGFNS
jgi:hypothetical protein